MSTSQQKEFTELTESLLNHLIGFLRFMRGNGYHIGIQEELDVMKMAEFSGLLEPQRMRWGLRALLCSSSDDWQHFNKLFDAYWKPANRTREHRRSYLNRMDSNIGLGGQQGGAQVAEVDRAEQGDDGDAGDDDDGDGDDEETV